MKKIIKLVAIIGIANLIPAFSSPSLETTPRTMEAKISIAIKNAIAKYTIKLTEILILVNVNGRL